MSEGELILYNTDDDAATIGLRAIDGMVWLSQREIAELFDKDVRTVNEHIRNVFSEVECDSEATFRKFRIVQTEGSRQVEREVDAYNLDVILSVGYRVCRSMANTGSTSPFTGAIARHWKSLSSRMHPSLSRLLGMPP
ncbi:RhuM family protein [Rhodospirillum sp. A1_3_36]|uniref:RhuM family protein n=1 Tax=Rhodospirillum sp. A1_3_36 TaxID=3391666 RepID=UPI0039A6C7E6